jgi:hypothetical protein
MLSAAEVFLTSKFQYDIGLSDHAAFHRSWMRIAVSASAGREVMKSSVFWDT